MGNADAGSVMMLSNDKDEMQIRKYDAPLLFFPFSLVGEGGENKRSERNALP
jgi:hypothetical protein